MTAGASRVEESAENAEDNFEEHARRTAADAEVAHALHESEIQLSESEIQLSTHEAQPEATHASDAADEVLLMSADPGLPSQVRYLNNILFRAWASSFCFFFPNHSSFHNL